MEELDDPVRQLENRTGDLEDWLVLLKRGETGLNTDEIRETVSEANPIYDKVYKEADLPTENLLMTHGEIDGSVNPVTSPSSPDASGGLGKPDMENLYNIGETQEALNSYLDILSCIKLRTEIEIEAPEYCTWDETTETYVRQEKIQGSREIVPGEDPESRKYIGVDD